jgi:hypothetical protein
MGLKNIHPSELIRRSCFVKDPSYDVINKIKESKEKKIILTGPSHSGKSVTLYEYTKSSINTKNDAIYISLDPCLNTKYFSNEELTYHFELMISNYIYRYIKNNYNDIYKKNLQLIIQFYYNKLTNLEIIQILNYITQIKKLIML